MYLVLMVVEITKKRYLIKNIKQRRNCLMIMTILELYMIIQIHSS